MKHYITVCLVLALALMLVSCFSSSGSLLGKTVSSDGSISKDNDEDSYYYGIEAEDDDTLTGLSIETDPDECDIYIDNIFKGVSPLFIENLDSGFYTIRAEHDGYYSKTESVYHSMYDYTRVDLVLEQKMGYLEISREPAEAEVLFDGSVIEGDRERVPVGTYPLVVRLFGYIEYRKYITISEDDLTSVSIQLEAAEFDITDLSVSKSRINPNAPSSLSETRIDISAANYGYGSVSILDGAGTAILSTDTMQFRKFVTSFKWDGRNSMGQVQPDGEYTIILTARADEESPLIERTVRVILDSSYVFDLWNSWHGTSGLLFSTLPSVLPAGSFSISLLAMLSIGRNEEGELLVRIPVQASIRFPLLEKTELGFQATFIASPNGLPVNAGVSLKYRILHIKYLDMAAYGRFSYVYDTQADSQANFTGLSAGMALSAGTGKLMLNLNPEVCASWTYPNYEEEAIDNDLYSWAYLRGGVYLDMFSWSAGLSASFRTRPFSEGFDIDLPFSAGAEVNFMISSIQMKISIVGALQWLSADDYYTSGGIGFGLVN
ncbi:MAG: PEGA domain-containing protein [Spirochaetales bacterium]|nr:PEGA domain-containing protein [Spirochaetales bacterium]